MVETLNSMLSELSKFKGNSREELLYKYIEERLDKAYRNYVSELKSSTEYLSRRKENNVLKKVNSYDKKINR